MKSLRSFVLVLFLGPLVSCIKQGEPDPYTKFCPNVKAIDSLMISIHKDFIEEGVVKIFVNDELAFDECSGVADSVELSEVEFYYSLEIYPYSYFNPSDSESEPVSTMVDVSVETASDCSQGFSTVLDEVGSIEWNEFALTCDNGYRGSVKFDP